MINTTTASDTATHDDTRTPKDYTDGKRRLRV
jgi:hypothetical protein